MDGAAVTVSLAPSLVALPAALLKTARKRLLSSASTVVGVVKLVLVVPAMGVQVSPESVLCCHWTVGDGVPVAADVNVAVAGAATVASAGCSVMLGAVCVGPVLSNGGGASALPPQALRTMASAASTARQRTESRRSEVGSTKAWRVRMAGPIKTRTARRGRASASTRASGGP